MDKHKGLHKLQEFEPKMPDFDEIGWLVTEGCSGSTALRRHELYELLKRSVRVLQLKKSGCNL